MTGRGMQVASRLAHMAHILVIEDDEVVAQLIASVLLEGGHSTTAAASLDRARTDGVALVITDLVASTGYALDRAAVWVGCVRRALPGIPVVVCTGHPAAAGHAAEMGADAVLTKPFDVEALLATVGRLTAGTPR